MNEPLELESSRQTNGERNALEALRQGIDETDRELLALLNRRAALSLEAGKAKALAGSPVFRPAREAALVDNLVENNRGPLPSEHLKTIYREIMASSRSLQQTINVAYLGPEGTFSNLACQEYFGQGFAYRPCDGLPDIFEAVENGTCDLGIVPLENSVHGSVPQSLDLFATHAVHVQAEWISRIRLSLMSGVASLQDITVVYSHPQPLGQCSAWLRRRLPRAGQISLESTAAAARQALEEPGAAAIGHTGLAERLGLRLLATGIEDTPDNWTRFFIIARQALREPEADKSSLVFTLIDKPGSLAAALNIFADAGINMSKLESRPRRSECWKYVFFADVDCDIYAAEHQPALDLLRKHCLSLRVLGSYPAGRKVHVRF